MQDGLTECQLAFPSLRRVLPSAFFQAAVVIVLTSTFRLIGPSPAAKLHLRAMMRLQQMFLQPAAALLLTRQRPLGSQGLDDVHQLADELVARVGPAAHIGDLVMKKNASITIHVFCPTFRRWRDESLPCHPREVRMCAIELKPELLQSIQVELEFIRRIDLLLIKNLVV